MGLWWYLYPISQCIIIIEVYIYDVPCMIMELSM
jgi:hypothetical protein